MENRKLKKQREKLPLFDMRPCPMSEVRALCEKYHGYGSMGRSGTYCFGVYESGVLVAGYVWQPPPPGAAAATCPEAPYGVLALSRMVAVPRGERILNHVSRPLRRQMSREIDRGRWPVLITYHDEGQGHTGHVYKCSGWAPTVRATRRVYESKSGARVSSYRGGSTDTAGLVRSGTTTIQRWEHWSCPRGDASKHIADAGWVRVPVPGKVWRSGNQAYTLVQA